MNVEDSDVEEESETESDCEQSLHENESLMKEMVREFEVERNF
jgi:hypothetical protein